MLFRSSNNFPFDLHFRIIDFIRTISHLQRNRQRPNNLPPTLPNSRIIPLGFRTCPLSRPRPSHSSCIRHKRKCIPTFRWYLGCELGYAQSHWRKSSFLNSFSLSPCVLGICGERAAFLMRLNAGFFVISTVRLVARRLPSSPQVPGPR